MNEITWKLSLQVKDGPKFDFNDVMSVHAYDKLDFEIAAGKTVQVAVQPGELADIQALLIVRTDGKTDSTHADTVRYALSGSQEWIRLDYLHVILGYQVLNLLKQVPDTLQFHNPFDKPASITIMIGRRASRDAQAPGQPDLTTGMQGRSKQDTSPAQSTPHAD